MRSMINLGLERTTRLLQLIAQRNQQSHFQPSWKAVHIAGTNGKGSVAAYLSALLKRSKDTSHDRQEYRVGRFTSPHFIDRWDCIVINDKPIAEDVFKRTELEVQNLAKQVEQQLIHEFEQKTSTPGHDSQPLSPRNGDATVPDQVLRDSRPTNFEILTATAFTIFSQPDLIPCEIAVIECGLGGRLDSTNVLPTPAIAVSVITRIGLDHLEMLGGTLRSIVREKLGILRKEIPVVIDGDNSEDVLTMIRDELHEKFGAEWAQKMVHYVRSTDLNDLIESENKETTNSSGQSQSKNSNIRLKALLPHQLTNLAMAVKAFEIVMKQRNDLSKSRFTNTTLSPTILNTALNDASQSYPARLQMLEPGWLVTITTRDAPEHHDLPTLNTLPVLLDGAHNEQSAIVLRDFVARETKSIDTDPNKPTIWILAMSSTKPPADILRTLFPDTPSSSSNSPKSSPKIIFTQFSPPDNMPWVRPATLSALSSAATSIGLSSTDDNDNDKNNNNSTKTNTNGNILGTTSHILEALDLVESHLQAHQLSNAPATTPLIVVAGSLYLASDFLRFIRDGREGFLKHFSETAYTT